MYWDWDWDGMGTYSNHSLLPRNIFVRQDSIDCSHSLLNIVLGAHLREREREREREGERERESMSYPIGRLHSTYQWDGMLSMKFLVNKLQISETFPQSPTAALTPRGAITHVTLQPNMLIKTHIHYFITYRNVRYFRKRLLESSLIDPSRPRHCPTAGCGHSRYTGGAGRGTGRSGAPPRTSRTKRPRTAR